MTIQIKRISKKKAQREVKAMQEFEDNPYPEVERQKRNEEFLKIMAEAFDRMPSDYD